ncbi:MAG TPA: hypothetical protein VFR81_26280 [Longimicrobium sp.]|nr:hypothetical protein [Longimicrobium sp.]
MSDDNGAKSFTLAIRFRCLCFFVPDPDNGRMHVLMPDTTGHAHHHDDGAHPAEHGAHPEAHHPAVSDTADPRGSGDDSGQPAPAAQGDGGGADEPIPLSAVNGDDAGGNGDKGAHDRHVVRLQYPPFGDNDFIKLEGWELEFGAGAGKADPRIPTRKVLGDESEIVEVAVADLSEVTGTGIDRALVGPNPGSSVVSRITLHAGSATDLEPDTTWELDGKRLKMASLLTWIIPNVPGEKLVLQPKRLDAGREPEANGPIPELVPNSHGVVELRIFHVAEQDFPPPLNGLDPEIASRHFSVYYGLYPGIAAAGIKLPVHRGKPNPAPGAAPAAVRDPARASDAGFVVADPQTLSVGCTQAQGRLNPEPVPA